MCIRDSNNKFYVLSFQSPADVFDKYVYLFERAKSSFSFLQPSQAKKTQEETGQAVLNVSCGTVSDSLTVQVERPEGLAWDGSNLWVSKEEPKNVDWGLTFYKLSSTGSVLDSFWVTVSGGHPTDGSYFWIEYSNPEATYFFRVDPSTRNATYIFNSSMLYLMGLAWDGSNLWVSDYFSTKKIYKLDQSGNVLDTIDERAELLAWGNSYLWVYLDGTIKKIEPNTGAVVGSGAMNPNYGCRDLAWDGSYLLCLDSNSAVVHKIDVSNC